MSLKDRPSSLLLMAPESKASCLDNSRPERNWKKRGNGPKEYRGFWTDGLIFVIVSSPALNFYTTLSQFLHRKKYQKHWPSPLPLSSQLGGGHLSALLEEELAPVHVGIYQVLIMPGAGWLLLGRCRWNRIAAQCWDRHEPDLIGWLGVAASSTALLLLEWTEAGYYCGTIHYILYCIHSIPLQLQLCVQTYLQLIWETYGTTCAKSQITLVPSQKSCNSNQITFTTFTGHWRCISTAGSAHFVLFCNISNRTLIYPFFALHLLLTRPIFHSREQ
jgi:hypothetical protein